MSQVIYARVPEAIKEAADYHADQRGVTLTAAVVDLIERGLSALSDEQSIGQLEVNLARATAEKAQLEGELQAVRAELVALEALAERARQPIGTCPKQSCGKDISGYDLLTIGRCGACGEALSSLIAPVVKGSTLNQRDFLILVGALGAVLGIAYYMSKESRS